MKDEDFREFYLHEWHRRDQIVSYVHVPMQVVTALAGGLVYLLSTHPHPFRGDSLTIAFWMAFVLATLGALTAIVCLIATVFGGDYARVPSLTKLRELKRERLKWETEQGNEDPKAATELYFVDFWERRLSEAQEANAARNSFKLQSLHFAWMALIPALLFAVIAAVPYFASTLNRGRDGQCEASDGLAGGGIPMESADLTVHVSLGEGTPPPPEPSNEKTYEERPPFKLSATGAPSPGPKPPPPEPQNDHTRDFRRKGPNWASSATFEGDEKIEHPAPPPEPQDRPRPTDPPPMEPANEVTKRELPCIETA